MKAKFSALKRLGGHLPDLARDLAGLAGAGLISYGAWIIYRPAGFLVAGAMLIVGSFLAARGE